MADSESRGKNPKDFVLFGMLWLCLLSLDRESCLGLGEFGGGSPDHLDLADFSIGAQVRLQNSLRASFSFSLSVWGGSTWLNYYTKQSIWVETNSHAMRFVWIFKIKQKSEEQCRASGKGVSRPHTERSIHAFTSPSASKDTYRFWLSAGGVAGLGN